MNGPFKAKYGCKNQSHDLLEWNGNENPPYELMGLTDKPVGHIQPKEEWFPALSCGPINQHLWGIWVIEPDEKAPRSGMVKSEVLLWTKKGLEDLTSLDSHISSLIKKKVFPISEFTYCILNNLANQLVKKNKALIVNSPESLPFLISYLWKNLSFKDRFNFSVRLRFSPPQSFDDINNTLYCVPTSLTNQWYSDGVTLVDFTNKEPLSRAAKYVIRDDTYCDTTFIDLVQQCKPYIYQLEGIARCADNIDKFRKENFFSHAIDALRTIILYAKDPTIAQFIKSELLQSIKKHLNSSGPPEDVLKIRNFPEEAFLDKQLPEYELKNWVKKNFLNLNIEIQNIFFQKLIALEANSWWHDNVISGIKEILDNPLAGSKLLNWLALDSFLPIADKILFVKKDIDSILFDVAKLSNYTYTQEEFKKITLLSETKEWPMMYAWANYHLCANAVVLQINKMPNWEDGIPFLISNIEKKQLIDAVEYKEITKFLDLFVERVLKSPELLQGIDINKSGAFSLWCKQLEHGGRFYPSNINKNAFKVILYNQLTSGWSSIIFNQIISEIAELFLHDSFASKKWSKLNSSEKKVTATYIVQILSNQPQLFNEYKFLPTEIANEWRDYLDSATMLFSEFILIFLSNYSFSDEEKIFKWLKKTTPSKWKENDLKRLVRIIRDHNWKKLIARLFNNYFLLPQFNLVVLDCSNLLSPWDFTLLRFYKGTISQSDRNLIIKKFSDLAAELAPDRLRHFWGRAGGDPKILNHQGLPVDIWLSAATCAEKGALQNGLIDLVQMLLEEFPMNHELLEIKKILERMSG